MAKSREEKLADQRAWYYANRERVRIYRKQYRKTEKGKESIKASRKRHYHKNRESYIAKSRKWYEHNKDKVRSSKHGLTRTERQAMAEKQSYCCAICGKYYPNLSDLHADHNHTTKQVRKLLCQDCNLILGNCHENISILEKAIDYLKQFNGSLS